MEITIKTSPKNIEVANMILGQGIQSLKENPHIRESFKLTEKDLDKAIKFQDSLLMAFFKQ